jgi:hypothetical protein
LSVALNVGMTLQSTIATVNGYRLRYVQDSRFGRLVGVDGTNKAFATIDDAIAFAKAQPTTAQRHAMAIVVAAGRWLRLRRGGAGA